METTRREFLAAGASAGAALALTSPLAGLVTTAAPAAKRILILGGTGFIGPNMVRYAVERGHEVSIFTRGRAQAEIPDVEHLIGDRNNDLSALRGRNWDVVIDNNTSRRYQWVQLSTEMLRDSTEHYIFVSSISAYNITLGGGNTADRLLYGPLVDEEYQRFTPPDTWSDGDDAPYGLMKALAEDIAHEAFPNRTTVVRPGLIVGPGDQTDRFTYWPVRIDAGGEVLAPGNPKHAMQIIDQRDLTEWIVRLAENGTMGNFNGTGPGTRLSVAEMLMGIKAMTARPVTFTWVPESFLASQAVRPWQDLPAWIPGDPLMFVDVQRAVAAGLTYRPLAVTARDTLEWDKTRPEERRQNRSFGMSREREREVLDAWHRANG